ncbi:SCO3870 family protein [Streptomyces albiaxialis]|uniref:SCO3870 family protein n=1 Tax=Streptomyces albiaxialis TaxID=329523 RepID=A0ABP5GZ37_9ACTN
MGKPQFGALAGALAALGTVLGVFAGELRADGYESYVSSVTNAAGVMYVAAGLVLLTWFRDARRRSE